MSDKGTASPRVTVTGDAAQAFLDGVRTKAKEWNALLDAVGMGTVEQRRDILNLSLYLVGTGQTYRKIAEMVGSKSLGGYRQGLLDAAKLRVKLPADNPITNALLVAWDGAPLREFGTIARDIRKQAVDAGLLDGGKGRKVATMQQDAEAWMDAVVKRISQAEATGATRAKRPILPWNVKAILVARLEGKAPPVIVFKAGSPPVPEATPPVVVTVTEKQTATRPRRKPAARTAAVG